MEAMVVFSHISVTFPLFKHWISIKKKKILPQWLQIQCHFQSKRLQIYIFNFSDKILGHQVKAGEGFDHFFKKKYIVSFQ